MASLSATRTGARKLCDGECYASRISAGSWGALGCLLLACSTTPELTAPPASTATRAGAGLASQHSANVRFRGQRRFVLGVARVAQDSKGAVTELVLAELAKLPLDVELRSIDADQLGLDGPTVEAEEATQSVAAKLEEWHVDALLWGKWSTHGERSLPELFLAARAPAGSQNLTLPSAGVDWAEWMRMAVITQAVRFDSFGYQFLAIDDSLAQMRELTRSTAFRAGIAPWSTNERWQALNLYATALWARDSQELLRESSAVFKEALLVAPRTDAPRRWATTQLDLGSVLGALLGPNGKHTNLNEAVQAFRSALEENRREQAPVAWLRSQELLGIALHHLAMDEQGNEHVLESVTALRAAAEEQQHDDISFRRPVRLANLGIALAALGTREQGIEHLLDAVASYRASLAELKRESYALFWAQTQHALGDALTTLATRESGTEHLLAAIAAYNAALEERRRSNVPWAWSLSQAKLGTALRLLASRQGEPACEAIVHHWNAVSLLLERRISPGLPLMREQLELLKSDFQTLPQPTPALCPAVPAAAWSAIQ
jgi:tetratricopeptide (TPR) repeat protein